MSACSGPTVTAAVPAETAAARLEALEERLRRGEVPAVGEVQALTRVPDRVVRGQAKRLLAHVLLAQARVSAATLLVDACEELDYVAPAAVQEAVAQVAGLRDWAAVTAVCLRASERLTAHGALIPALVQLQNALTTDLAHGSNRTNDPAFLRRVIGVYERVARQAQAATGVRQTQRGRRRSPAGGKLRLAHVVAQIVSGGHAPSRAIEAMLKFADRERFETLLCVTESLSPHEQQAGQLLVSDTSDRRGAERIRRFEQEYGVPVLRPGTRASFVAAAADLHAQFAQRGIDVAFFHGSVATPTEWLLCAWQAAPWQLDGGFGVPLHCPAVDYQFFEFAETMEKLAFWCRERGIAYGLKPTGADLSHVEQAVALSRAELGVPADHVILGTVGNHLPTRMSPQFCRTVAAVMRREPKTTFLVVGPGSFAVQRQELGAELCDGPQPRVRFTGPVREPERLTKAFDIYLNSYPDGGGFVLGDAMAAGKPIVCMVVGNSTYAQAGATWVGAENLVTPPTDEAYAARLTELIRDPAQRAALGRRLRQRYEEKFDARRWVAALTERVLRTVAGAPQPQD